MDFPAGRHNLYLTEIGEPEDNRLRVVVIEANGRGPLELTEVGEARLMIADGDSRAFELIWVDYVVYAVRNESYARIENDEVRSGDSLHARTNSAFMNYACAATIANDDYPGPLVHWALDTLNHCLDVISVEPPKVRALARHELERPATNLSWIKG